MRAYARRQPPPLGAGNGFARFKTSRIRRRRTAPPARCGGAPAFSLHKQEYALVVGSIRVLAVTFLAAAIFAPSAPADPLSFMPPQYIDESFPGGEPVLQVDTVHHSIVYSSHEGTT